MVFIVLFCSVSIHFPKNYHLPIKNKHSSLNPVQIIFHVSDEKTIWQFADTICRVQIAPTIWWFEIVQTKLSNHYYEHISQVVFRWVSFHLLNQWFLNLFYWSPSLHDQTLDFNEVDHNVTRKYWLRLSLKVTLKMRDTIMVTLIILTHWIGINWMMQMWKR